MSEAKTICLASNGKSVPEVEEVIRNFERKLKKHRGQRIGIREFIHPKDYIVGVIDTGTLSLWVDSETKNLEVVVPTISLERVRQDGSRAYARQSELFRVPMSYHTGLTTDPTMKNIQLEFVAIGDEAVYKSIDAYLHRTCGV